MGRGQGNQRETPSVLTVLGHTCAHVDTHTQPWNMCVRKCAWGAHVYASRIRLCVECMSTCTRVPMCVGCVHIRAPCTYMHRVHMETHHCAMYMVLFFQDPVTCPWVSLRVRVAAPNL